MQVQEAMQTTQTTDPTLAPFKANMAVVEPQVVPAACLAPLASLINHSRPLEGKTPATHWPEKSADASEANQTGSESSLSCRARPAPRTR